VQDVDPDKIFQISTTWVVFLIVVLPALALGGLIALSYAANS
jgi:hypothetical protein